MPTQFDDVNVKCPFFLRSDVRKITCEGISDKSVLEVVTEKKIERDRIKELYCDKYYKLCPIHQMLKKEADDEM